MEDIDKNGDGFIDLEEYIGEWNTVLGMIFKIWKCFLKVFLCFYTLHKEVNV